MAKEKKQNLGGLLIGAGTLIGVGVGFITYNIPVATLIGIGVGLIAAFVYGAIKKGTVKYRVLS